MTKDPQAAGDGVQAAKQSPAPAPLTIIWPLLGRHIAFHRRLVDLTANVKAALLLSQSLYWTGHGRDIEVNDGWFVKTTRQWALETGLSAKEQATARELLRTQSILEERRLGVPARLHFRVCLDEVAARLSVRLGPDWRDGAVVAELLGPSLAYHRALARIAGGVHAGLMLSRALHLTRLQYHRRLDAWICNSAARWTAEIGLTRREQESARRDLERSGLWEETLRGIPPSLMARIRLDCLLALLTGSLRDRAPRQSVVDSVGGLTADCVSQKGKTRVRDPHILVSPKTPNQICRNRHHSIAESAIVLIDHSTSDSLQPQNSAAGIEEPPVMSRGGELVFPEQLLPGECAAAGHLLRASGDQAQALLDELAGRLRVRGVRSSPIAYLRGLIARAAVGSFVPELGLRIAAQRLQREEEQRQRIARALEEERLAAERASPVYQAEAQAHRESVSQRIAAMKQRLRTGKPS